MSDFEVCPVGTLQRLAAAKAERDALRAELERLSDVVSKVNARCDYLGIRLGDVMRERDALLKAAKLVIAWYEAEDDHSKADFYERMGMCRESEAACRAAIAKAVGGGNG